MGTTRKFGLLDKQNKDLRPWLILLLGLLLLGIKLLLCSGQRVFLWPDEAVLDDMVAYNQAVSIADGQWLGAYTWTTLAKHSFFSLWLAVLHLLHIPYLLGGQLLWAGASAAAAGAFLPTLKKRWLALGLFVVLLFNPASIANPTPYGFTLRVYRDNIFPALCVLAVVGMVGFALRYRARLRRSVWWLVLAGMGLAAAWLTREDGWWLLPFMLCAAVVTLVFVLRTDEKWKAKLARGIALCLPFAVLAGGILAWCGVNYAYYGRFIVSDFSSGEFADAYGAMTRIQGESWDPKTAVPADVRQQLYEMVPEFAVLEPHLESERYLQKYGNHNSGAFYWALREAAAEEGYYDTPQKAQQYFETLAEKINALGDSGALPASGRRSSVSPPIRGEYIAPVTKEALYSLWFCATFQQSDARPMFSPASNDPGFYAETIAPMEDFLEEKALTATKENSTEPYFTPVQNLQFQLLDILRYGYAVLLPCALAAALTWQVLAGVQFVGRLRKKQKSSTQSLLWWIMAGILLCILLRVFMVAFVTVSSFTIGTFIMYLASVHPLMLLYGFVGTTLLVRQLLAWRRAKREKRQQPAAGKE